MENLTCKGLFDVITKDKITYKRTNESKQIDAVI